MSLTDWKTFLLAVLFTGLSACGGGDSSSSNTETVDNRPPDEKIVGSWLSPCTSILSSEDPTVHYRTTLTFNDDKSMHMVIRHYETNDCINLISDGDIVTEVSGIYQVGGEATDSEDKAATELDVTYGELKINNTVINADVNSVNLVVFRVEGNRFFSHDLNYLGNNPFTRFNYISGFYFYTRQ